MTSIGQQTSIGVVWKFLEQLLYRGITTGLTIALAWFLTPEDFGVVAMMVVFMAVSRAAVNAGFNQALIRKAEVSEQDLNTAFLANLILSFIAYGILFGIAPYVSIFYEENRLTDLIRVAGLSVIFHALSLVHQALLNRQLNFKVELKVSLPAVLISGTLAVVLAYKGLGVWALVAQIVVTPMFTSFFYWRLRLWSPSFSVSMASLRELFGFGGYLLISQLTDVLFRHMYVIVIAKVFATGLTGLYFFADRIKELVITQVVYSIQHVTYPALSKVQHDDAKLKNGYRSVLSLTTFLLFPAMLLLAALAEPLFSAILPEKWSGATLFVQLMSLAALMSPLNQLNVNILSVKGRPELVLYIGICTKIMAVGIFVVALQFGIVAILIGQILAAVLAYLPISYYSSRLIDYSVVEQAADALPNLLLSVFVASAVYAAQYWLELPAIAELALLTIFALGLFLLGAYLSGLNSLLLAKQYIQRLR